MGSVQTRGVKPKPHRSWDPASPRSHDSDHKARTGLLMSRPACEASLILELNPIRKPATLRSERYCYGDKEHRADPEEARRVVCSRSDFTAPTGQAGQLLVVKLYAGEAIAKVSGHAGTTGSCNCAAPQNCSITRVSTATLLSLVNKIINEKKNKKKQKKKKNAKTDGDPLRGLLNVSPSSINEGGQSEKTGVILIHEYEGGISSLVDEAVYRLIITGEHDDS
ncbi:hypothetical protein ALC56_02036 [Trachymyrmex septentrionalis]|uniref:Uncharacterized protein n=1 Tax=Trachymyrmex septentrionalis TaxID=34720 RepID=A0A195FTI6_9HYME|nr:hypothetical protein ALC56_02036 [Trachymyrmex septentrionalis]